MITMQEAAKRKGCSKSAIHYAIGAGKIDAMKSSPRNLLVITNSKFDEWTPNPQRQQIGRKSQSPKKSKQ
jgi:hypothetical protein